MAIYQKLLLVIATRSFYRLVEQLIDLSRKFLSYRIEITREAFSKVKLMQLLAHLLQFLGYFRNHVHICVNLDAKFIGKDIYKLDSRRS